MPAIAIATQTARTQRRLSLRRYGAHQLEQREADIALQLVVAANADVRITPSPRPLFAVKTMEAVWPALNLLRRSTRAP